jgi:hypothetical protein
LASRARRRGIDVASEIASFATIGGPVATKKQITAAKQNVEKAQAAARRDRSIAHLPAKTRSALGRQGAAVATRRRTGGTTPRTRRELYEEARRRDVRGRSRMGRAELARALGRA